MNKHILKNQGGQALLFVIVAMTIALTVGVAITSRTISSLRRTSSTDTSSRVFSAAEGGIEWFLRQPVTVLQALSDGDTDGGSQCPAGTTFDETNPAACVIVYEPKEGDNIQAKAQITVEGFNTNYTVSGDENYWFTLNPGTVKEVALKNLGGDTFYRGGLDICWKSLEPTQSSGLYLLTYNEDGIAQKQIVSPSSITGTFVVSGDVSAGTGRLEYDSCYDFDVDQDIDGLRIKSLYAPSKVAVFPQADGFPTQGFKITSLGQIDNVAEKVRATKQISVYRSLPYAPSVFDYAIYSDAPID